MCFGTAFMKFVKFWRHLKQFVIHWQFIISITNSRVTIQICYGFNKILSIQVFRYGVCLQDDNPLSIFGEDSFFYFYNLNFKESRVLASSANPTTSHVKWCFWLVMHWVHVWTCICTCTVLMPGHIVNRTINREIILLCSRVNFSDVECPPRSLQTASIIGSLVGDQFK